MEPKSTVLIVDDENFFIDLLVELLEDDYSLHIAKDGISALTIIESGMHPDLILLDVMMMGMNGYEVCERLHNNPETRDIPVIFLTIRREVQDEIRGFSLGAVDYITKPISPPVLRARVATHLRLKNLTDQLARQKLELQIKVHERTRDLEHAMDMAVFCLSSMAINRSHGSHNQMIRIQEMVMLLGEGLRGIGAFPETLSSGWLQRLRKVAPLYDLGKFDIPDEILAKPSSLSEQEWELMRMHPGSGGLTLDQAERALGHSDFLQMARDVVLNHHERWDGQGYPNGLAQEQIPLAGRMVALIDVYDTMLHKQSYKKALPHQQAVDYILENAGRHFDPLLVRVFDKRQDEFFKIAERYP